MAYLTGSEVGREEQANGTVVIAREIVEDHDGRNPVLYEAVCPACPEWGVTDLGIDGIPDTDDDKPQQFHQLFEARSYAAEHVHD